ncbi:MAG: hypothetical protein IJ567_09280 [Lachnospiraceae bacterium]|nr:hypothetical protein [Lachnospiraceae bacterium]
MRDYHFSAPMKLKNNEEEYQQICADKQKLESDPGFMQILEEVNRSKALVDDLNKKTNQFIEKKGELKSEIKKENENLKEITGKIYTNQNQYEEFRSQHPELEQTMLADYDRFRQRSEDARVIKQKTVDNLRGDVDKAKNAMENAQLEYLRAAGISNLEMRGVSYISFFSKEKREISNVKIEEASNKLELYAREMESTFMTDFVNEMNESMKAAIEEKNMINDELKHLPFGNDTYTFTMDEREDRSEFFRICRKLNDYGSVEMLQSMNTEDEELSHDVRNFMDKILSEPDESEYTDYRRYYKYDMKIRTRRGNDEVEADFSKKQGSASNGEKQTPYFIILAASLMQCYPKGVECARIAFIDEAFAALSRERIEQMVKYLEENRFQVMYAAPPEKIASIGNLIDTTVSLVSSGRYTKMIEGLVSR